MDINLNIDNVSQVEGLLGMINEQIDSLNSAMSSVSNKIGTLGITLASASLLNVDLDANLSGLSLHELEARIRDIRIKLAKLDESMADIFSKSDGIELNEYGNFDVLKNGGVVMGMLYDQYSKEYENIPYGANGDNLASNGCGFFSVLSVITAKTGYVFSYDEISDLASWAMSDGRSALSNEKKMELVAEHLSEQFGYTFTRDSSNLLDSVLERGGGAISLTPLGGNNSGHFISFSGKMENGNYAINDTNGQKYRASKSYKEKVDVTGFNIENGDIKIVKKWVQGVPEGELWYFEFGDNVKYYTDGINELNDVLENLDVSS